jgi:hypothetical protein
VSTAAEIAKSPTPVASEFRCSRCREQIETEGEHLELISRTIAQEIRLGDDSSLYGDEKWFPANRYCIKCSYSVLASAGSKIISPEMIVVLLPDLKIGQHLRRIFPAVRLRLIGECGMSVLTLRWIDPSTIYVLLADTGAGDYREHKYQLSDGRCEQIAGVPTSALIEKRLVLMVSDKARMFLKDFLPVEEYPRPAAESPAAKPAKPAKKPKTFDLNAIPGFGSVPIASPRIDEESWFLSPPPPTVQPPQAAPWPAPTPISVPSVTDSAGPAT